LQRKLRHRRPSRGHSRWLKGRKAGLVVRDDKLNPGEAATRTLELVASPSAVFPARFNFSAR
jgi:hypothetical protein